MELQTNKLSYYHEFPLPVRSNGNSNGNIASAHKSAEKQTRIDKQASENIETDLPILATANDLREVVKFLKREPNGVSVIEIMNAEPRRVFDARKIAAYEFWGVIERSEDRLKLTDLGEEFATNTEAECEINRRILRSISSYLSAIEWIYKEKIKIATSFDVADFWRGEQDRININLDNESNLEASIVSFFSLCHAAELGTATVGKRGQPARLTINFEQINLFLKSSVEKKETLKSLPTAFQYNYSANKINSENVNCVYISGENSATAIENLSSALELADFNNIAYIEKHAPHEILQTAQIDLMKQCQAAIFLLDENDCVRQKGATFLRCERVTEISVARALFGERVIILWQSREAPPDGLQQSDINVFVSENLDWEMNVKLVKYLKNLKN